MTLQNLNINKNAFYALIAAAVLAYASLFQVFEHESFLIVQFGKIVRKIENPGLKAKIPFIQNAVVFDKRFLKVNLPAKEIISVDQKRFIVDAYLIYKIHDMTKFYESFHNQHNAELKIRSIFDSDMRQVIAKNNLTDLFNNENKTAMLEEISKLLSESMSQFGVLLHDIKIVRIDLPSENIDSIFNRMKSERLKEAQLLRSEGEEMYIKIIAEADKEASLIKSNAGVEANKMIAEGKYESIKLVSEKAKQDPEFYEFYKSLKSYSELLEENKNMKINVSPQNFKFFKYLSKD